MLLLHRGQQWWLVMCGCVHTLAEACVCLSWGRLNFHLPCALSDWWGLMLSLEAEQNAWWLMYWRGGQKWPAREPIASASGVPRLTSRDLSEVTPLYEVSFIQLIDIFIHGDLSFLRITRSLMDEDGKGFWIADAYCVQPGCRAQGYSNDALPEAPMHPSDHNGHKTWWLAPLETHICVDIRVQMFDPTNKKSFYIIIYQMLKLNCIYCYTIYNKCN